MRRLVPAAAALLLASCYDPSGRCTVDTDCLADQVCGADHLCVPGTRPPPGNPPVAAPDTYAFTGPGPFDVPASGSAPPVGVLANDTDPAQHPLTAVLVSGPAYGQLFLAPDGSFTYAPIQGFTGSDGFTYRATDGVLSSAVTGVTIAVSP
ncbi:MAG TPA: Ig-like domain-containing protein [Anaeromyxobacter sp.]